MKKKNSRVNYYKKGYLSRRVARLLSLGAVVVVELGLDVLLLEPGVLGGRRVVEVGGVVALRPHLALDLLHQPLLLGSPPLLPDVVQSHLVVLLLTPVEVLHNEPCDWVPAIFVFFRLITIRYGLNSCWANEDVGIQRDCAEGRSHQ